MVEKLFEKFFEASRKVANRSDKLKYAAIDNNKGVAVVEYDTDLGYYSNALKRNTAIGVKLVIHKPDERGDIMVDIILPVPGIDRCMITKRIRARASTDSFVSAAANEVNMAAFDLALTSSRTIPYIDQISTDDDDPVDQPECSDYDKAVNKLTNALSKKYNFIKLIGSDDYVAYVYEDTKTYLSHSLNSDQRVHVRVGTEYDDGLLFVTVKAYGPDMPGKCLYVEIVITPGEDEDTGISSAMATITELVDCLRTILNYVREMK